MEEIMKLFGYLVLTMLGFIIPVVGFLIPFYQDGIKKLAEQYESKKNRISETIKKHTDDIEKLEKMDENTNNIEKKIKDIQNLIKKFNTDQKKSHKKFNKDQKKSHKKIKSLNPKTQVIKLFVPLFISFLCILIYFLLIENIIFSYILISCSVILFFYTLFIFWKLILIIIEVSIKTKDIKDKQKEEFNQQILNILDKLDNIKSQPENVELEKVFIKIEEDDIKDNLLEINFVLNKKKELQISTRNSEARMAKKTEIGFVFPLDFIIEESSGYSIHNSNNEQIVRFNSEFIQGNTILEHAILTITALKKGKYEVKTFVKGENIKTIHRNFKISVIE